MKKGFFLGLLFGLLIAVGWPLYFAAKKAQGLSRKKVGSKWKWGSRLSSKGATDCD